MGSLTRGRVKVCGGNLETSLARVVTRSELANAFGQSLVDFERKLPHLYRLGFPQPDGGAEGHWNIADLIEWISGQQDLNVSFVRHIEDWIEMLPN